MSEADLKEALQAEVNMLIKRINQAGYELWVSLSDEYGGSQGGEITHLDKLYVK